MRKKLLKWSKQNRRRISNDFLPLETELFYYEHLLDSSDNLQLIQDFCVTNTSGYGLERYIKELAESDEKDGSARTYLVKDRFTHEIVAYFSLKSGLFTIDAGNDYFYSISGIELANFAVNSSYRKNHPDAKNLGSTVFAEFVLPLPFSEETVIRPTVIFG